MEPITTLDGLLGLKEGDRGSAVERLQSLLNISMEPWEVKLKINGIFGSDTREALMTFQRKNNHNGYGYHVDLTTLTLLYELMGGKDSRFFTTPAKKLELLLIQAQLMYLNPNHPRLPQNELTLLGSETRDLLRYFQINNHIRVSGECDYLTRKTLHEAVLRKRNGKELTNIFHRKTKQIGQSEKMSCWAAGAAMVKDISEKYVLGLVEKNNPELGNKKAGLLTGQYYHQPEMEYLGGNVHKLPGVVEKKFADLVGLKFYEYSPPNRIPVSVLCKLLKHSPVMVSTSYAGYVTKKESMSERFWRGKDTSGHYRVIVGVISDDDPSGKVTYIVIYDPWTAEDDEPFRGGIGRAYINNFYEFMNSGEHHKGFYTDIHLHPL